MRLAAVRVLHVALDHHLQPEGCRAVILGARLTDALMKEGHPQATTTWEELRRVYQYRYRRTHRFRLDSTPSEGAGATTAVDIVKVKVERGYLSRGRTRPIRRFRVDRIRAAVQSSKPTLYLHHSPPSPLPTMPLVGEHEGRAFEYSTFMFYARDAKDILEPNETQRNTLIVAAAYIVAIGILWYVFSSSPYRDIHPVHRHVPYLNKISEYTKP